MGWLLSRVDSVVEGTLEPVATGSSGTDDCLEASTSAMESIESKSTLCVLVAVRLLDLETDTLSLEDPLDSGAGKASSERVEPTTPATSAFHISCTPATHSCPCTEC